MSTSPTAVSLVAQNTLSLLDADPELANWIAPEQRDEARHTTRVPEVILKPGPFDPGEIFIQGRQGFGAMIISGLIAREVRLGGRPALRLLGPGDILIDASPGANALDSAGTWNAALATHLAILDDHLLVAVRRWPRLLRGLCSRMQQCHDATLMQLSISHRPAVEDRIVGLFGLLADRWGRVTPEGVVVPIPLTHDAIGQMVGARRPTVSLGLRALALQGRLYRQDAGRWLLGPDFSGARSASRRQPLTVVLD
jgi:CRP/FNR family transcriptional regulator, cyclic AMP receptor protein